MSMAAQMDEPGGRSWRTNPRDRAGWERSGWDGPMLNKPAWIALMILGFMLFWPVGLAILAYLLWSKRMGCGRRGPWDEMRARWRERCSSYGWTRHESSGNSAFDEYRSETLRRLEEEQKEFMDFLDRLRQAKDKAEFDQFMSERRNRQQGPDQGPASNGGPSGNGGSSSNGGPSPQA